MAVAHGAADAISAAGSGYQSVARWWSALVDANPCAVAVRNAEQADVLLPDLDRRSADLARALLLAGYGKGSRIGLLIGNGPDWIAAWLATQRVGALAVLLSTFFAPDELRYAVRHSDCALLLFDPDYLGKDFVARAETAIPELGEIAVSGKLAIGSIPFLREIWSTAPCRRAWVARDFRDAERCGASIALGCPDLLTEAESEVAPDDLSSIIYTSGSTAYPKAVSHRQSTIADKIRFLSDNAAIIPCEAEAGDCVLITTPLFWVGGFLSCFGALDSGASVAFAPPLPAEQLWPIAERVGATHITGPESVLRSLQDHLGADQPLASRLKPQNSNQMAWFRGRAGFDEAQIGSAFGMTETMGPHSGFRSLDDTYGALRGSVGHALAGVERRIVDPHSCRPLPIGETGELQVRGRWLMDGYYKQPASACFDAEGYFSTGDFCHLDADGLLHFVGRGNGMIKTSGANVAPEEVEVALRGCDGVVEAAVVGLPDAKRGQVVAAAVALRPGASADEQALREKLRTKLSSFKIPRLIRFVPLEDMPRTASSKIDHRGIARQIMENFGD